MPTSRPGRQIAETDEVAAGTDLAASIDIAAARRRLVEANAGGFVYRPDELDKLDLDWPE